MECSLLGKNSLSYLVIYSRLTMYSCALSWFFLDVAYYGLSLNNATILQAIGYSTNGAKTT